MTSAPSLLGGLVRCDCEVSCALTTATGTSRTGKVYAYYKCIQATKQGRHREDNGANCVNRKIPRPVIEKLVVEALTDQLLQPDRVTSILLALKARRDERQASADRRIVDLARQASEAEERLGRLYAAIEAGTIDGTDPSLKERVAALKASRDRAAEALDYAKKASGTPIEIDPIAIDRFTRLMRDQLTSGDVAARKAYLSSVVDAVIVSEDKIRIVGSNDNIRSTFGPDGQPTPRVRKSVQTVARGFSGPLGRSARNANGARVQPLKINHLYALNANDTLVFEAGFAFPAEFYFRPQMVDVGDGSILALVTNANEMQGLQTAMSQFAREPKDVTLPRPKKQKDYDIVTFDEIGGHWRPGARRKQAKPSRLFFRELSTGSRVPPMTARLAQNDDGNLFARAKDLDAVGALFDLIFQNRMAGPRPPLPPGPGQQTWVFGIECNYVKVFKAVLKTGMNLVAHLFGAGALLGDHAFDRCRSILLECPETDEATKICRLYPDTPTDFPRPAGDAHQMMLDVHQGALRFRMRLYGSFGYEAILAPSIAPVVAPIAAGLPRRVLVDHEGAGIHEVASW